MTLLIGLLPLQCLAVCACEKSVLFCFFCCFFFHFSFFFRRRRCWQQLWQLSPRWCRDRCPSSVSPRYGSSRATPTNNKTEQKHPLRNACPGKKRAFISVGSLSQHYLGEAAVILPEAYRHCFVAQGELEPILRLCLLDPSFPALVEKVEAELRKLREEWRISTTAEGRKVKLVHCVFLIQFV